MVLAANINGKHYELDPAKKRAYYVHVCKLGEGGMASVDLVLDPLRTYAAYLENYHITHPGKRPLSVEDLIKKIDNLKGTLRKNPNAFDGQWGAFFEPKRRHNLRFSALKSMRSDRTDEPHRYRFLREAYLGEKVTKDARDDAGQHIVECYDSNGDEFYSLFDYAETMTRMGKKANIGDLEIPRSLFISMRFLKGLLAQDELKKASLTEKLDYFIGCCRALDFIHHRNIVHRDVKYDNFLARKENGILEVRVSDFGLARVFNRDVDKDKINRFTEEAGWAMGTPAYMSPEQARNFFDADVQSDVWSLGMMMYEMFGRHNPFVGADPEATLHKVALTTQTPSPRSFNMRFFEVCDPKNELEKIITRAVDVDKEERYKTAAELEQDLSEYKKFVAAEGIKEPRVDSIMLRTENLTVEGSDGTTMDLRE